MIQDKKNRNHIKSHTLTDSSTAHIGKQDTNEKVYSVEHLKIKSVLYDTVRNDANINYVFQLL